MIIESFIVYLGIVLGVQKYGRLPFSLAPVLAASAIIVAGFLIGIIGLFNAGIWMFHVLGIGLFGHSLWQYFKSKEDDGPPLIYQPGLWALLAVALTLPWLADFVFTFNDEFSHWGLILRNMLAQKSLITADSVMQIYHYPPGSAIFQYFFTVFEGYHEGYIYTAQLILALAAGCAFVPVVKDKMQIIYAASVLFAAIGLIAMFYNLFSLYIDMILGLFFGVAIVTYFALRDDGEKRVYAALPLMVLPLLKPAGVLLAGMAAFILLGFEIYRLCSRQDRKRSALILCILLCAPVIMQGAFKYYHSSLPPQKIYPERYGHMEMVKSLMAGTLDEFQAEVTGKYKHAVFDKSMVDINTDLKAPWYPGKGFTALDIMLVIALFWAAAFFLERDRYTRREQIGVGLSLAFGAGIYLFLLLMMYLVNFKEYEALRLASFKRYLGIYFLPWLLVTIYYLARSVFSQLDDGPVLRWLENRRGLFVSVKTLVCLGTLSVLGVAMADNIVARADSGYQPRVKHVRSLAAETTKHLSSGDRVFVVWQHSHGFEVYVYHYYMAPEYKAWGASLGAPHGPKDIWTKPGSDLMEFLAGYNYLVVAHSERSFWEKYAAYFDKGITDKVFEPCVSGGVKGEASRQVLFKIDHDKEIGTGISFVSVLEPVADKTFSKDMTACKRPG